MITTGIVKNILTDVNNTTIYKLDIPIFRNPGFASDPYLYEATASVNPGTYNPYSIDDLVYVGFVDNKFSQPVILGKIYKNLPSDDEESATYQFLNTIKVTDKAELPINTTIGNISYQEIVENLKTLEIISDDLIILSQGGKDKWLHTNEITGALEWSVLPYPAVNYLKSARIEDGYLILVDQDDNEIIYSGGGSGGIQDVTMPNGTSIVDDDSIAILPDYGISYDASQMPDTDFFRTWLTDSFDDYPNDTYDATEYYDKLDTVVYHNETYVSVYDSNIGHTPGTDNWWEIYSEGTRRSPQNVSPLKNSLEGLDTRSLIYDGINDIPQETIFEDIEDQVGGLDTSGKVYN